MIYCSNNRKGKHIIIEQIILAEIESRLTILMDIDKCQ